MAQSIVELPESAMINADWLYLEIKDHKPANGAKLFGIIMSVVDSASSDKNTLPKLEGYGISFEALIEQCCKELEDGHQVLADVISWRYFNYKTKTTDQNKNWDKIHNFTKTPEGKMVTEQFAEKIRDCENWEELFYEMRTDSKFSQDIKNIIFRGMKQCHKV